MTSSILPIKLRFLPLRRLKRLCDPGVQHCFSEFSSGDNKSRIEVIEPDIESKPRTRDLTLKGFHNFSEL